MWEKREAACALQPAPSEGSTIVSGAVDTLDPIEAARADIVGSKHLIAAVADDLNQHQQWLKNYRVSEERHARWLQFQELRYQTELKRRAFVRSVKRFALAVAL